MKKVLQDPATVEQVTNLTKDLSTAILKDPQTRSAGSLLAADAVKNLLKNEESRQLILDYVEAIIMDERTQQSCKELLRMLGENQENKEILANFFKRVLSTDTVKSQATVLGLEVTQQVVTDKNVQEQAGNAFWNILKRLMTPSWLF